MSFFSSDKRDESENITVHKEWFCSQILVTWLAAKLLAKVVLARCVGFCKAKPRFELTNAWFTCSLWMCWTKSSSKKLLAVIQAWLKGFCDSNLTTSHSQFLKMTFTVNSLSLNISLVTFFFAFEKIFDLMSRKYNWQYKNGKAYDVFINTSLLNNFEGCFSSLGRKYDASPTASPFSPFMFFLPL